MTCKQVHNTTYIYQPGMTAIDHLINMGRMILASKKCDCELCRKLLVPSELGTIAVNVELSRRHYPVKVLQALVENWDAEKIIMEFSEPPRPQNDSS